MTLTVETEVRYLNDEWRHRAGLASIGRRESRRANTRKHNVFIRDARAKRDELSLEVRYPQRTFATVDHIIPTQSQLRPFQDPMAEEMAAASDDEDDEGEEGDDGGRIGRR